jgi:hypothetical protein
MNTQKVSRKWMSKVQKALVAVVILAMLFGALPTGKAHAWAYRNITGRPGAVSVPTVRFGDTLLQTSAGLIAAPRFDSAGRYVYAYRSPATSGDQTVKALYVLEGWSGSGWVKIAHQGWMTRVIRAGQSYVAFPALDISPSNFRRGSYYRVTWSVIWATPAGAGLGGTRVVSNLASDHRCVTTRYLCTSYAGYVLIR